MNRTALIVSLLRDGDEYRAASLAADDITSGETIRIDRLTEIGERVADDLGRPAAEDFVRNSIAIAVRRKDSLGRRIGRISKPPGVFERWTYALVAYAIVIFVLTCVVGSIVVACRVVFYGAF